MKYWLSVWSSILDVAVAVVLDTFDVVDVLSFMDVLDSVEVEIRNVVVEVCSIGDVLADVEVETRIIFC